MSKFPDQIAKRFGSTPRFEDDKEFLPLQAADFLAWWVRKWHDEGRDDLVASGGFGLYKPSTAHYYRYDVEITENNITDWIIKKVKRQHPDLIIYDLKYPEKPLNFG